MNRQAKPVHILIIDADQQFASLIQETLEASGDFRIFLAADGREGLNMLDVCEPDLAIVDLEPPDMEGMQLIQTLRRAAPGLKLIAIPPSNQQELPPDQLMQLDGVLDKPFYLPDLPELVSRVMGLRLDAAEGRDPKETARPAPPSGPVPPWLAEESQARRFLTQLLPLTNASALLVTRGAQLWAAAGKLASAQIDNLVRELNRMERLAASREAVVRFVRVGSSQLQHLLVDLPLIGAFRLACLFPPDIPFQLARRQAQSMRNFLVEAGPQGLAEEAPTPTPVNETGEAGSAGPHPSAAMSGTPTQPPQEVPALPEDWLPVKPRSPEGLPFLQELDLPDQVQKPVPPSPQAPRLPPSLPFSALFVSKRRSLVSPPAVHGAIRKRVVEICEQQGWQLVACSAKGYLMGLTLHLPPDVPPAIAFQHIAHHLASQLSGQERLSSLSDFWAPKFLLASGERIPPDAIERFLAGQGGNSQPHQDSP